MMSVFFMNFTLYREIYILYVSYMKVYPIKYGNGCGEHNFVSDSCDLFAHFLQVYFISTSPVIYSHV